MAVCCWTSIPPTPWPLSRCVRVVGERRDAAQALSIPAPIIYTGKFLVAWPLCYHFLNGISHLDCPPIHYHSLSIAQAWDAMIGFSLKTTNLTGWVSLFASLGMGAYFTVL